MLSEDNINIMFLTEVDTRAITTQNDYRIEEYETMLPKIKSERSIVRVLCLIKQHLGMDIPTGFRQGHYFWSINIYSFFLTCLSSHFSTFLTYLQFVVTFLRCSYNLSFTPSLPFFFLPHSFWEWQPCLSLYGALITQ